ncbi:unnamed protein product [Penicillium nalgiovense]|uniref:Uncharacterized protein n=1 Tax=Penicillium nalgiovense TaxID=60175 RepID=A0A9W4H9P4_PENNA|nr:unnamed protein product [Penicillium nalgiovense]CAG7953447.1 unnamed protein product [Penicillium nalgiovense]CAG7956390.1 unnamed protein product [Penicillium nalgiovense]CAG7959714.1 unnamed protein product [Penicillium nalgiovense]CAG7966328.1 unnamed protein product [Penicillium nalgiovense]
MFKPLDDDIVLLEHGLTPMEISIPILPRKFVWAAFMRPFPLRLKIASRSLVRSLSTLTLRYIYVKSNQRLEIGDRGRLTYWRYSLLTRYALVPTVICCT